MFWKKFFIRAVTPVTLTILYYLKTKNMWLLYALIPIILMAFLISYVSYKNNN